MIYKCPECGKESPKEEWKETEIYCEICYSHDALRCPRCGEDIDVVLHYQCFPDIK